MGEIEPKLKAMILGVPTLVLIAFVAFWMSSTDGVSFSIEVIALVVPLGLGVGWMVLNLYTISENI